MPNRFRKDIIYFSTPAGEPGVPTLLPGEFWISIEDARNWVDECVLHLISPLDSENEAEVEITDEQLDWLDWLITNNIQRVRIE